MLDHLIVRFKLSTTREQISDFETNNDLIRTNTPRATHGLEGHYTYIIGDASGERDPIDVAKTLYLNNSILRDCYAGRGEFYKLH